MATLSRSEAKTERARKHAKRRWTCPICGVVCKGNGGKSSHKRKHLRNARMTLGDWHYLLCVAEPLDSPGPSRYDKKS